MTAGRHIAGPPGEKRRRNPIASAGALLVTLGFVLLLTAAPASAVTSAQIVATINAERAANGIPPVVEDPALSAGCAEYDRYRQTNGSLENAFTLGAEKSSLPGYTAAGARASHDSLVNAGDTPGDSWANGDVFDTAPGHLVALMDPAVSRIGADQLDFEFGFFGTVSLTCVDVRSAPVRTPPRRVRAYLYRGPDGKAPPDPAYREGPHGSGPYLFVYFLVPRHETIRLTRLRITTPRGGIIQPSYVELTGGLTRGRPLAHRAKATTNSKTKGITIRMKGPLKEEAHVTTGWEPQYEKERRQREKEFDRSMREQYERREKEYQAHFAVQPGTTNPP
jgi:hypothetical protein